MANKFIPQKTVYFDYIDIPIMGYCGLQMTYHRIYFTV